MSALLVDIATHGEICGQQVVLQDTGGMGTVEAEVKRPAEQPADEPAAKRVRIVEPEVVVPQIDEQAGPLEGERPEHLEDQMLVETVEKEVTGPEAVLEEEQLKEDEMEEEMTIDEVNPPMLDDGAIDGGTAEDAEPAADDEQPQEAAEYFTEPEGELVEPVATSIPAEGTAEPVPPSIEVEKSEADAGKAHEQTPGRGPMSPDRAGAIDGGPSGADAGEGTSKRGRSQIKWDPLASSALKHEPVPTPQLERGSGRGGRGARGTGRGSKRAPSQGS
eukprot:jgi/Botrbrau1/22808/Bobra.0132s0133.1